MSQAKTIILYAYLIHQGYPDDFVVGLSEALEADAVSGEAKSVAFAASILEQARTSKIEGPLGNVIRHAFAILDISRTNAELTHRLKAISTLKEISDEASDGPLADRIAMKKIATAISLLKL